MSEVTAKPLNMIEMWIAENDRKAQMELDRGEHADLGKIQLYCSSNVTLGAREAITLDDRHCQDRAKRINGIVGLLQDTYNSNWTFGLTLSSAITQGAGAVLGFVSLGVAGVDTAAKACGAFAGALTSLSGLFDQQKQGQQVVLQHGQRVNWQSHDDRQQASQQARAAAKAALDGQAGTDQGEHRAKEGILAS